jgi:hypothetical protein
MIPGSFLLYLHSHQHHHGGPISLFCLTLITSQRPHLQNLQYINLGVKFPTHTIWGTQWNLSAWHCLYCLLLASCKRICACSPSNWSVLLQTKEGAGAIEKQWTASSLLMVSWEPQNFQSRYASLLNWMTQLNDIIMKQWDLQGPQTKFDSI